MRFRILVLALMTLAVLSATIASLIAVRPSESPRVVQSQGEVSIGGPFTLVDHTGKRVSEADFRGRYMLVYFGYTFCPDMCPLGLQTIATALDKLPPNVAAQIVPVFITVDPARDTVPVMRNYVAAFHPRLVGLTGSNDEIEAVKRAFRIYARKADSAGPSDYLVDHSTFIYLFGPDGHYVTHFGHDVTPEAVVERVTKLVRG